VLLLEGGLFLVDCVGLVWAVGKHVWWQVKRTLKYPGKPVRSGFAEHSANFRTKI
jgi:hypothetical protein